MIVIRIDEPMPKSCEACQFLVHCDDCESWENFCPLIHKRAGYDRVQNHQAFPVVLSDRRRDDCPLQEVEAYEQL